MKNNNYSSIKYPKLSDYRSQYSIWFLFVISLFAAIYFINYKFQTLDGLIKSIFIWPIFYLALTTYNKIHRINMLISKIENLFKNNLSLSKEIKDNSEQLLLCDISYKSQRKKESLIILSFTIVLIANMVMLKYFQSNGSLFFFYSAWVLILSLIISFFFSAGNIFRFFFEVNTSCFYLTAKIKDDMEATYGKQSMIGLAEFKDKRNKCLFIITSVIFLSSIVSFIFVEFRDTARFASILIVLALLMSSMTDIDNIIKLNLKVLGDYDEYTKAKLGIEFKNIKDTDFSPYLSDNIKYLIDSNKYLIRDMFNAVKEITRELTSTFKKNKK